MRPRGGRVPHGALGPATLRVPVGALKTILALAAFAALAYAGLLALMWATQDGQLFYPQPARGDPAAPPGWAIEKVAIHAADGTTLAGVLLMPPGDGGDGRRRFAAVIYFGGNAEEVTAYAPFAEETYGRRAVLLVNYRGYGESGGRPGEQALVADAKTLHDWLAHRPGIDTQRICAHGTSLGTGVAVQLAAARPLRCLVLASPFDSLVAVGHNHMPWLPMGLLLRHPFHSIAHAPVITAPALVVVGGADTLIPPAHSEALAAAWGGPVERLKLDGVGHNDIGGDPRYPRAVRSFLDRHL